MTLAQDGTEVVVNTNPDFSDRVICCTRNAGICNQFIPYIIPVLARQQAQRSHVAKSPSGWGSAQESGSHVTGATTNGSRCSPPTAGS